MANLDKILKQLQDKHVSLLTHLLKAFHLVLHVNKYYICYSSWMTCMFHKIIHIYSGYWNYFRSGHVFLDNVIIDINIHKPLPKIFAKYKARMTTFIFINIILHYENFSNNFPPYSWHCEYEYDIHLLKNINAYA